MRIEITTAPTHSTESHRVGNWITFKCPTCDYVRTMNETTGEIKVVAKGDENVLHSGMSYPTGIDENYPMN